MFKEPDNEYSIPLWQVNHSRERLMLEEQSDWMAFRLGYQMEPTSVDPSKVAYKNFDKKENVTEMDYYEGAKVALMMDFNRSPQTAALGVKMNTGDYIVFDEIITDNALSSEQGIEVAKRINSWSINHVYLYGDNTSNQKTGRYGKTGKNDWQYIKEALQKAGITFTSKLRQQNPKRKVRVDKVNAVIYNPTTNKRRLFINARCEWVIQDYLQSAINEKGIKVDSGKIGHASDAVDYWIYESESTSGVKYVL